MSSTSQSATSSDPGPSSSAPPSSSSAPTSSSLPTSSAPPPTSSTPLPSSSAPTSTSSSPASSSLPPTSSLPSTSSAPTSTSATPSPILSVSPSLQVSTNSDGSVETHTQFVTQTFGTALPSASESAAVRAATKGFLQNKGAVAATFTIVGLVVAGIIFALVTNAVRRRRAKRFDREIAEEAKRVPAPVFVDDDDDYNNGYSSAVYAGGAGGGYSDLAYGGGADAYPLNNAAHRQGDPYTAANVGPASGHGPSSEGYPASDAVHSGGTPSNYMYPSGYSDLGFSDVSSHGTYAQPPMDAYSSSNNHGYGGGNGGGAAAYGMGAAAAGAGAYEMTGYGHAQQAQVGQDWHAQAGQGGYVYPGEEAHAHAAPVQGGYPPTATSATANSSNDGLARNKSGARSLVGGTPGSEGSASAKGVSVQQPQYADGYVNQYQTHVEDGDAYGGMESHHGHVGEVDDDASFYGEEENQNERRVLKVANE